MRNCFSLVYFLVFATVECDRQRIAGGNRAVLGQFPYFAQILIQREDPEGEPFYILCGGSLIQTRFVLTAAHCFPRDKTEFNYVLDMKLVQVYMGSVITHNPRIPNITTNALKNYATKVIIHPDYEVRFPNDDEDLEEDFVRNDVAVLELEKGYYHSENVQVVHLAGALNYPCRTCGIVMGKGIEHDKSKPSPYLKYAFVQPIEHRHLSDPNLYTPVNNTVFYVEKPLYKGHSMMGDSGGPFVCYSKTTHVQHGIVSTGRRNVELKTDIGVYEDVICHLDFIQSVVPDLLLYPKVQQHGRTMKKNFEEWGSCGVHSVTFRLYFCFVSSLCLKTLYR